jgi:protein SCO1/2
MTSQDTPPPQGSQSTSRLVSPNLVIVIVAGLAAGLLLSWIIVRFLSGSLQIGSYEFHGTLFDPPAVIEDFQLSSVDDYETRLSDFRGEVVLIYFGYTFCPDICPATMNELKTAVETLSRRDREQVQVLMITVDPQRDSPETLASFLEHFDPSFIGLSGTDEQIAMASEMFGVYYAKQPGTVNTGYLVDHTASVFTLDKKGDLRVIYSFNTPGEDIAADLRRLVDE